MRQRAAHGIVGFMKLHVNGLWITIDTSVVNDPAPQNDVERVSFVKDAISEANHWLQRGKTGIRLEGFVEDPDIRVEN